MRLIATSSSTHSRSPNLGVVERGLGQLFRLTFHMTVFVEYMYPRAAQAQLTTLNIFTINGTTMDKRLFIDSIDLLSKAAYSSCSPAACPLLVASGTPTDATTRATDKASRKNPYCIRSHWPVRAPLPVSNAAYAQRVRLTWEEVRCNPFNTGYLPLSDSDSPGVRWRISHECIPMSFLQGERKRSPNPPFKTPSSLHDTQRISCA